MRLTITNCDSVLVTGENHACKYDLKRALYTAVFKNGILSKAAWTEKKFKGACGIGCVVPIQIIVETDVILQ